MASYDQQYLEQYDGKAPTLARALYLPDATLGAKAQMQSGYHPHLGGGTLGSAL